MALPTFSSENCLSPLRDKEKACTFAPETKNKSKMNKKLYRSMTDKRLCGICGGLGEYFEIDPTIIRLIWVILTFCSFGCGFWAYIIAALIVPKQKELPNP